MNRIQSMMVKRVTSHLMMGWFRDFYPTQREAERLAVHALGDTKYESIQKALALIEKQREETK